jgi:hypothetical protein
MFERISNSWELVKASAAVLRADKELVVFPIVSAITLVIVTATFAVPLYSIGFFDSGNGDFGTAQYLVIFAFYLVQYFVIIFANSALVGAALIRLRGGDPTLGDGFRIAKSHLGSILGYAAIAATVGMVLRALRDSSDREGPWALVGVVASALLGAAWSLATFLVVPVLVTEDLGPIEAIKRSLHLLRKTWGEQIVGSFSIGLIFGLLALAVMVIGVLTFMAASATGTVALVVIVALVVLALLGLGLLSSTLGGIYSAAVYNYAVNGQVGEFFSQDLIKNAFRPKKRGSNLARR